MTFKKFYNTSVEGRQYKTVSVKPKSFFEPNSQQQEKECIEFASGKGKGIFIIWEGGDVVVSGKELYEPKVASLTQENLGLKARVEELTKSNTALSAENTQLKTDKVSAAAIATITNDKDLAVRKKVAKDMGIELNGNQSIETVNRLIAEASK